MKPIIPRLNYQWTWSDFIQSVIALFSSKISDNTLLKLLDVEQLFYTNHARTALRIALSSLGLPKGSRVGVFIYNCHTVPGAVIKAGYEPVFIDVTDDFTIDTVDLAAKVSKLDALIVTHLFGLPTDVQSIKTRYPKLPIIEDCAHAFYTFYQGKILGSVGDMATYSTGKAKFPSVASGGYLMVNNKHYEQAVQLAYHALPKASFLSELKSVCMSPVMALLHKPWLYGFFTLPILKAKTPVDRDEQESTMLRTTKRVYLCNKISHIDYLVSKQKTNASIILSGINNHNSLTISKNVVSSQTNSFMIPCRVGNPQAYVNFAVSRGVELGRHFSNAIMWATKFGYTLGSCPNGEKLVREVLVIPCSYNLSKDQVQKIEHVLRDYSL